MKLHGGTSSEHTKPSTRTEREKPAEALSGSNAGAAGIQSDDNF